jgi:hypothetical protein
VLNYYQQIGSVIDIGLDSIPYFVDDFILTDITAGECKTLTKLFDIDFNRRHFRSNSVFFQTLFGQAFDERINR